MKTINFKSIGKIHSQFKNLEGMPIQPIGALGIKGEIHLMRIPKGINVIYFISQIVIFYYKPIMETFIMFNL